jgi:hypothetical protein
MIPTQIHSFWDILVSIPICRLIWYEAAKKFELWRTPFYDLILISKKN